MNKSPGQGHVNMTPRSRRGTSTSGLSRSVDPRIVKEMESQLLKKDAALHAMALRIQRLESEIISVKSNKSNIEKRIHPLVAEAHEISDKGRKEKLVGRSSLATSAILDTVTATKKSTISAEEELMKETCQKFLRVFQTPVDYIEYLSSMDFANALMKLCDNVIELFKLESRCMFLQSPCYVFGDIHGNLEDLHFFSDNVWKLGMDLTAGQFLFLGDYVDRGKSGIECVAYLFAMKLLYPKKIYMLRGNHEVRDVNGWEEHYADKSFISQCKTRFGNSVGETVWEKVNQVFDCLPLAGVIDHDIFCIHGGIPRPTYDEFNNICMDEVGSILSVPSTASVMPAGPDEDEDMQQVCLDCMWSDPASEAMEPGLDEDGFGESPRGGGAICFGNTAIDNFLQRNNLSYIIRAHEAHAQGVALSKSARVFTVFSTSQDHRQGGGALAGCVLVDMDNIKVINRSSKYKNKYVHRRSSVSLEGLTQEQVEDRRKLGLVRYSLQARVDESSESEKDSPDCKPQLKQYEMTDNTNHKSPHNNMKINTGKSSKSPSTCSKYLECSENNNGNVVDDVESGHSSSNDNNSGSEPSSPSSVFQNLVPSWISKAL